MKSVLSKNDIENFWIRVYLDNSCGYKIAAIKRAYRDFNRTLKGLPQTEEERNVLREKWIAALGSKITELLSHEFTEQEEFTKWHQSTCYRLRTANESYHLSQGQAQKWINMTLKYLFALGETRVSGISKNYAFFHIPIDNIIQEKLEQLGIPKFETVWSKIPDYDSYNNYQKLVRQVFKDQIPMDVEFKLFNEV